GGPVTTDITKLVRPELRLQLSTALHRVFDQKRAVLTIPIAVSFNGAARQVFLQVRTVRRDNGSSIALVMFIEGEEVPLGQESSDSIQETPHGGEALQLLHEELRDTRSRLKVNLEEYKAANEELRAANEELQSISEKYRSTAEELETSKEELQSVNEELQTVNNELKLKLDSVSRANSDLQNLMAAMDFGTLFLDPGLRIKRFTPRLADLFSITPGDVGRPITDFTHQLEYDGLVADARAVLDHLAPIEREIRSTKGGWDLVRVRPYRTVDDKIDGVVATFIDVTERRQMEDALRNATEKLEKHNGKNGGRARAKKEE